jgi:pimeloyl-ACP methyl ester carboxylesterase
MYVMPAALSVPAGCAIVPLCKATHGMKRGLNMKLQGADKSRMFTNLIAMTLFAALALPVCVLAQRPPHQIKRIPSVQRTLAALPIPLLQQAQTPRLSSLGMRNIISAPCPPDAVALNPAVFCGYLPVPLERKNPKEEKINIYFELYPHTNPGPAVSAIVPNVGGPGSPTAIIRGGWFGFFAPDLDVHDLLLIDDRGRGLSDALGVTVCQDLQHGTAPSFDQAVAQCAAQLGDDNSRYGTGDIALDVEAVRAALGYDKLDYYGASYGGMDAIAYATRFGEHLRSAVLSSPFGPPALLPFSFVHLEAPATLRAVRLDCLRSPACSIDHPKPDAEWEALIRTIRNHPLDGMAYDAFGTLKSVHFDESVLLVLAEFPAGSYLSTGEFLAAADALEKGDPAPLLRLGAEGYAPYLSDSGDPVTNFSGVALNATDNADSQLPFDWSVPPRERLEQFEEVVSNLPTDYFHPFSVAAATSLENVQAVERAAIYWEEASPAEPVVPLGARYPQVPIFVMAGDIETIIPVELASKVAALFPESTFVSVAGGVHHPDFGGNQCAMGLTIHFIETLQVGDTSCTEMPETIWPAVGRFPLRAKDARPAAVDPDGVNEIGTAERKVVTVAVAAATDAAQRLTINFGDGVGLRAGTFHADFGSTATIITLSNCAFANDVTVNGAVVWGSSFQADLTVSGAGTSGGILHVEGTFLAPGPVGKFKVSGMLGGKQVAVLVPEG